jgi:hypothetical protein
MTTQTRKRPSTGIVSADKIRKTSATKAKAEAVEAIEDATATAKATTKAALEAEAWEAHQRTLLAAVRDAQARNEPGVAWADVAAMSDAEVREVVWRCRTTDGAVRKIATVFPAPVETTEETADA